MKKGMSQVLALIVGAAVFVMVGVSLMYIFTDSIGGSETNIDITQCRQSINGVCATRGPGDIPPTCTNSEGDVPSEVSSQIQQIQGNQITCN